jgi:hypothetical protein
MKVDDPLRRNVEDAIQIVLACSNVLNNERNDLLQWKFTMDTKKETEPKDDHRVGNILKFFGNRIGTFTGV